MVSYRSGSLMGTSLFRDPVFELTSNSHSLQGELFESFREFDLKLENIQETAAVPTPANWQLYMSFLSFRASVRVKVDGFELTFLNPQMNDAAIIKDVWKRAESAFASALRETRVVRRDLVLHAHFEIPDGGYRTITQRYWGPSPDGLGELSGQGVGFYLRNPLFSDEASVVLEKSILIEDGLYVQTRCGFDAGTFDLETMATHFTSYVRKLIEVLGGTN